jgi:hypothetical protein
MKIQIPEKYLKKFSPDNKAYLSHWKNNSIWVMSSKEKDAIFNKLRDLELKNKKQIVNFIGLGMIDVAIVDTTIEIPDNLIDYIGTKNPRVVCEEDKVVIKN